MPSAPAGAQTGTPAPAATAGTRNVACWGDSITNLYAPHLQQLFPDRQVFNGGVSGETSMQINARVQADTAHRDCVSIFWYGHNNWNKEQVIADITASIATLQPNTPFVVLSLLTWAPEVAGTDAYNAVLQVNAALAAKYPDNYFDMRSYLVSLYNPNNAQDLADHASDITPSSLRFDTIHPNDAGCNAIAAKLREFILAKGW
jgi:lysophospholipase L1-like esterase